MSGSDRDDLPSAERPPIELRTAERLPSVHFVWYRILEGKEGLDSPQAEGICKMDNISETGVGLYALEPLPAGKSVFVEIAATRFNVSAIGKVIYCGEMENGYHRVGIEFRAVSPAHRMLLKTWLLQNCDFRLRRSRPPSQLPPFADAERRRAKRLTLNEFIWYHVVDEDGGAASANGVCILVDISETGIGFCTAEPLPIGATVFVEINTKEIEVSAVGRVVHTTFIATRHYRSGLRFESIPPNDRLMLGKALNRDATI